MDAFAMPPASADEQTQDGDDSLDLTPVKKKCLDFDVNKDGGRGSIVDSLLLDSPGKQSTCDSVKTLVSEDMPQASKLGTKTDQKPPKSPTRLAKSQHIEDFSDPLHSFEAINETSSTADMNTALTLTEVSRPSKVNR